jgi:hypothetical protein
MSEEGLGLQAWEADPELIALGALVLTRPLEASPLASLEVTGNQSGQAMDLVSLLQKYCVALEKILNLSVLLCKFQRWSQIISKGHP